MTSPERPSRRQLGLTVLLFYLLTFVISRVTVFVIMSREAPDLYLHIDGSHVHHLIYGILLVLALPGYLLFARSSARHLRIVAAVYGICLAFVFDEFGMVLNPFGGYWQITSCRAVAIVAGLLVLITFLPEGNPRGRWRRILALVVGCAALSVILMAGIQVVWDHLSPTFLFLQATEPH